MINEEKDYIVYSIGFVEFTTSDGEVIKIDNVIDYDLHFERGGKRDSLMLNTSGVISPYLLGCKKITHVDIQLRIIEDFTEYKTRNTIKSYGCRLTSVMYHEHIATEGLDRTTVIFKGKIFR